MKNWIKKVTFGLLITTFMSGLLFGQTFTLTVQNQSAVGSEFHFDIYMLRTGGTAVYLGDSDFVLTFNSGNFTGPTYEVVTAGLTGWYSFGLDIVSGNRAVVNLQKPPFSNQTEFDARVQAISNSGNGTLIASVKITGITNSSGTAGLQWRTVTPNQTIVTTLDNVDPWLSSDITGGGTYTNPADESLPVQMSGMEAESTVEGIKLSWETSSEVHSLGFHVWRSESEDGEYERITTSLIAGQGNSSAGAVYNFTDKNFQANLTYYYRIEQLDSDGGKAMFGAIEVKALFIPTEYALSQNYPNPFNPSTTFTYDVPEVSEVTITVYSLLGKEVRTLYSEQQMPGRYTETWDGTDNTGRKLASGVYFLRMQAGSYSKLRKMTLIR
jgi:hypothetical protein